MSIRTVTNSVIPEGPEIPNMLTSHDINPSEDKATNLDIVNPLSLRSGITRETSGNVARPSI